MRPPWLLPAVLLLAACGGGGASIDGAPAPSTSAAPTTTTAPIVSSSWSGTGYDLHGDVVVSVEAPLGVATRPEVRVDGEAVGTGILTVWVDADTPEAVADLAAADCAALDAQLDRWSDVLYRRDVPDGDKAQADAYIGFGMTRVAELGCDYEVDTEGRASPFP